MGVAGIAMLFSVVFFFKSIVSFIKYMQWKRKETIVGNIGELIKTEEIEKSTRYYFSVNLRDLQSGTQIKYTESVRYGKEPSVRIGDPVEVFYDPRNKQYRIKIELMKDLRTNVLCLVLCLLVLLGCFLIVMGLSR